MGGLERRRFCSVLPLTPQELVLQQRAGLSACQLLGGKEGEWTLGMVPSCAHPSAGINTSNSYHLVLAVPRRPVEGASSCQGKMRSGVQSLLQYP